MMKRRILLLILILTLPNLVFGQRTRNRNDEKECGICHVQWSPDLKDKSALLPKLEASTVIDGRPGVVSHEQMCLSCHDGYVNDSREVFASSNHKAGMDKGHIKIQGLPLGTKGQIYCGTCHTPHALRPNKPGGLAPFLRKEAINSTLCLDCHSSNAKDHGNHPIKIKLAPGQKIPDGGSIGTDGTIECLTCHPMHGDRPVLAVTGEDRRELCVSCHEAYFQIEMTDHDIPSQLNRSQDALGPNLAGQDVCASCHKSHNGFGDVMWPQSIDMSQGKNAYCLGCHSDEGSGRTKSFSHTGHAVKDKKFKKAIPALGIKVGDDLSCISCHDPHQWAKTGKHVLTAANEEGTEYTSFLKFPDDAQGQLCIACHADQSAIAKSDHSVSRQGFQEYFKSTGTFDGQCSVCHDTHGTGLTGKTKDMTRALCETCHTGVHAQSAVGGFDHPMDIAVDPNIKLPTQSGKITCITCHDPHKWGKSHTASLTANLEGNDSNSFLRRSNWPKPELCLTCHSDQSEILDTDHDLSDDTHNACSFCHAAHNADEPYGLVNTWDENAGSTMNEHICFSCHQAGGTAEKKIPQAWTHPHEYGTITHSVRGTGTWKDFPLFEMDKPADVVGFIDCFTCHDPHRWSFKKDTSVEAGVNEEGNYMTSFLRNPSYQTLCTDCHGANTLWKFNYYHDPVKRKRY